MIVSASYRTDIPAFYGEWFRRRLEAGEAWVQNPYGGPPYRVNLRPEETEGIVFWTKNVGPFRAALAEVAARGLPFVVQYTITGYPRALEQAVVDAMRAVEQAQEIAAAYGPRVVVWRYDPILISSLTPESYHRRSFALLAAALAGATDEVVISFAQYYAKTRRGLAAAERLHHFTATDPDDDTKRALAAELAEIAAAHRMRLSVCSQAALTPPNGSAARCIDAGRLSDVAGKSIQAPVKGNRPDCACHQSRDIGAYDTCPHGCVYCYAVQHRALAQRRYAAHNPRSPFLFLTDKG